MPSEIPTPKPPLNKLKKALMSSFVDSESDFQEREFKRKKIHRLSSRVAVETLLSAAESTSDPVLPAPKRRIVIFA